MTDTETEIQSKGLTAPRVTPADIEAEIMSTEIVKHVSKTGQVLRWAILNTRSGYSVTGQASCAVSSENDDAELGEKIARANAVDALWPLMGFHLKQQLHERA